jgi:23S rRNA-/tRNA-specific pseudouridylate synthase
MLPVLISYTLGVPCCPTVGNYHENVAECVRKCGGLPKLFQPHRLDQDTSGIMIYGKTATFNYKIHTAIQNHLMFKRYRLLVAHMDVFGYEKTPVTFPIAGSHLTHYMENSTTQPRILHNNDNGTLNTKICKSKVLKQSEIVSKSLDEWQKCAMAWDKKLSHTLNSSTGAATDSTRLTAAIQSWTNISDKYSNYASFDKDRIGSSVLSLCELEVELITGRTHQLRAQVLTPSIPL